MSADPNSNRPSKLTPEQRTAIAADDRTCRAVAADYGVSAMAVSMIKRGTWGRAESPRKQRKRLAAGGA